MLAPSVGHYVFTRVDGQPLDFIPGQFIQVHFSYADGTAAKRSYSLATIRDHQGSPPKRQASHVRRTDPHPGERRRGTKS